MIERDNSNYFVAKYNIDERIARAKNVSLYAEINDNPEFPSEGTYKLDVYLSIEPIAFREHVVGLIFGENEMEKAEIFDFVDSIIEGQLDDGFNLLVKQMLHNSNLMEKYPFIPDEH